MQTANATMMLGGVVHPKLVIPGAPTGKLGIVIPRHESSL